VSDDNTFTKSLENGAAFATAPIGGGLLGFLVTPKSIAACDCEWGREFGCRLMRFLERPSCDNYLGVEFPGTGNVDPVPFGTVSGFVIAGILLGLRSILVSKNN